MPVAPDKSRLMRGTRLADAASRQMQIHAIEAQAEAAGDGLRCDVVPGRAVERQASSSAHLRRPSRDDGASEPATAMARQRLDSGFAGVRRCSH